MERLNPFPKTLKMQLRAYKAKILNTSHIRIYYIILATFGKRPV